MATYYITPTGSDSNDGSAAQPWATIQKAAANATPGTIVHVAPGTYEQAEGTSLRTKSSGTASARIVYVSDTLWGASIRSTGAEYVWSNYGDYVDIIGFDISGDGRIGIHNEGSFCTVQKCHVHDIPALNVGNMGGAGIVHANYAASDNDTIGNVVHNIGTGVDKFTHGIYHSNLRGHIWNNLSYNNSGYGIHLWHAATNVVVSSNLVFENRRGGIAVGAGDAPGGITNDYTQVTNNIVIYNHGRGVRESGNVGSNNQYLNNLIYGSETSQLVMLQHDVTAIDTLTIDPQLINYLPDGTGDYHLSASSVCIDAGTSAGAPPTDVDGVSRPQGAGWDIGPYEYSG